jgi:6-phosphofructo-2-kinase/fructose-2,6-biphosphatase 4
VRTERQERVGKGEVLPDENPLIVGLSRLSKWDTDGQVWTSARRRAYHTAWPFVQSRVKVTQKPIMAEINPYVT